MKLIYGYCCTSQQQQTINNMSFKIIRPYQLAEMLGVHRATIHRMEKRGELPKRREFSKRLFGWTESEIHEWLESTRKDISETEAVK